MGAQAKTINLLLHYGSLQGVVCIEDSGWYSGEMYSAPRESMQKLLATDACGKYGVYLLLSRDRVYVGQSSDLASRLAQHLGGKGWWTSAVVLTTKDNSLIRSDIDWLESALIERARSVGCLDCDNRQRGNPVKVDRFREVWLSQYLNEALFLMEFIGIPVFAAGTRTGERARGAARIDVTDVRNQLAFGKRMKSLAVQYASEHGARVSGDVSYAVLGESSADFFLNPRVSMLDCAWSIILNDTARNELIVLLVPACSLGVAHDGSQGLALRSNSATMLDLHIHPESLVDRRSGTDFSRFLVARVPY